MKDRQSRLLSEVCAVGNLDDYRHTLTILFRVIKASECKLSTRYDVEYSNIEDSIEHGNHIRISLKNVENPLDIVWKLLHEYGHFLSGRRKKADSILEREELAWNFADNLVKNYPQLMLEKKSYDKCKEECLNSYRRFLLNNDGQNT